MFAPEEGFEPPSRSCGITATKLINPVKLVLNNKFDNISSLLRFDLLLPPSGFTLARECFLENEDPGSTPFGPAFVRRVVIE